jgi:vacuolar-type H+-ATPase subunit I/STV1
MSQGTLNFLLGASISLVASILTIIATSVFQFIRDSTTRKWQLKDHEEEIARQLMAHRIDELEEFTKEIVSAISSINTELMSIIRSENNEEILSYCQKIHTDVINPAVQKAEHYLALSLYFHNDVLFERFRKIVHIISDLSKITTDIVVALKDNNKLDIKKIETQLGKTSFLKSYGLLLLTFDLVRSNPNKLFTTLKTPKGGKSKRESKKIEKTVIK